ncbi:type IV fimbrial biogenesis protein FimT [Pseudoduganella flava]|uniref:Prepilin-type N-terminal cleavage/methylation domain-containing protein n=1 Tax=Pseudoduganella flava TaxID=871742 RepID=A0A562Q0V8_9BURK|nr:prepilin-type N-terminal cleavage/methylation domain-containing protein [Pseudoduganella flava]QGZ38387.1 prepilin-type N-terminal cleavage/methylation domain-containing protein [Pseudoduganella flava]TWI50070.1 type IV fimbrial biogenesis protein FimT [Pseudoduganella flava]
MLQLTRRGTGFTLVEMMVAIVILGVLLAVGIPNLTNWIMTNKARSAAEFYLDGMSMARRQAVTHNARSRLVLTPNANGQFDWQVDLCFPAPGAACTDDAGNWSTATAPAAGDPEGATGFKSVFRAANALPPSDVLIPAVTPEGTNVIYFTEVGWVDPTIADRLTQLRLDPAARLAGDVRPVALTVTLAGIASKCDPTVAAPDSRACPP